jgi:hypothetical protein
MIVSFISLEPVLIPSFAAVPLPPSQSPAKGPGTAANALGLAGAEIPMSDAQDR